MLYHHITLAMLFERLGGIHRQADPELLKSIKPSVTGAQIYNAMTSTALDIRAPGIDRDSGYGIVMAPAAIDAILK